MIQWYLIAALLFNCRSRSDENTNFNLDNFWRIMLSLSIILESWLGDLSTIAIVLNQLSLLQLSRKGGRKGDSMDSCKKTSIAELTNGCKTNNSTRYKNLSLPEGFSLLTLFNYWSNAHFLITGCSFHRIIIY